MHFLLTQIYEEKCDRAGEGAQIFPADQLVLCLDTGHYVYGGGDTIAFLEKQVSRVCCVHLKDCL